MPLRYQGLLAILIVTILGLSSNLIIPAFFSSQLPIDPDNLTSDYNPNPPQAYFNNQPISAPQTPIADSTVLGDVTPTNNKRIEIDLTNQRLYAYENDKLVYNFLISSGKWNRTPTGTYAIWTKIRSQKMSGGSKLLGDYYYLPNVPYIMFFAGGNITQSQGFSLHGTYWHNNFGHPMSHGCINMKTSEAAIIYQWAMPNLGDKTSIRASADNPGTPITIYGKYRY